MSLVRYLLVSMLAAALAVAGAGLSSASAVGAVPTVTGVSPDKGPASGDGAVIITGTGFTNVQGVFFGGTLVNRYVVDSPTQIRAQTRAGSGTVDVTVVTDGGTSATSAADQYTYVDAPAVTALSPASGPTAGGMAVTITGSALTGGTVTFGATSAQVVSSSDTQIVATAPPHTAGTVDVTVSTPGGVSATSAADQFTYVPAPVISDITPSDGPAAGGTPVTIFGSGFGGGATVTFDGSFVQATVVSDTQINVTAPAGTGSVDVVVTTAGGSATNSFTYVPAPIITSLTPDRGPTSGGTEVTITGSGLSGATVLIDGNLVSSTAVSDSKITATVPSGTGTVGVLVITGGGSAGKSFSYVPAPIITGISPASGPTAGGTEVTITGTGFEGATVTFGGTPATSTTVVSGTKITATTPAGSGAAAVEVTTAGGSASSSFVYVPAPTISGISPASGPTAGGTSVVITGTGFDGGATVMFGGTPATSSTVDSATQITATAPAGTGIVDVSVTTIGGTTANTAQDDYAYRPVPPPVASLPVVSGISPASGAAEGGTRVTLTGSGFSGATSVSFGSAAGESVSVVSDSEIQVVSPAHAAGDVTVHVTTPSGTNADAPTFTYEKTASPVVHRPVVAGVAPHAGRMKGGDRVRIVGSGFTGATAVRFGTRSARSFRVVSDTEIRVVTPAGAGRVGVRVTTPAGTNDAGRASTFRYQARPVVRGLSRHHASHMGGGHLVVRGAGFSHVIGVLVGKRQITDVTVLSSRRLRLVLPRHARGSVVVRVITAGGRSTARPSARLSFR